MLDFICKKRQNFRVTSDFMRHSFKDKDGIWKELGESRSIEDALLEREHDDPAAIAKEAAKEGISVESYLICARTKSKSIGYGEWSRPETK